MVFLVFWAMDHWEGRVLRSDGLAHWTDQLSPTLRMTEQSALLTKEDLAKVMEGICPKCRGEVQTVVKRKAYTCTPCKTLYEIRQYVGGDEGPLT